MRASTAAACRLLLVGLFLPVTASAVESEIICTMDSVIVSATRLANRLELDSAAISVIDRSEIERSGARVVADVLRALPGIEVRVNGQYGGQASLFLRGANSNHTLALIDGIPANSAFSGYCDFSNLSVDDVERVEVVRGPQSLLYGSEALGGIVNIVTRRGAGGRSGSLRATSGAHALRDVQGDVRLGNDRARATVAGSWLSTENDRANSDYEAGHVAVSGDWTASPRWRLGGQASSFTSRFGMPNDRFTNDPNDEGRNRNRLAAVFVDGRPGDRLTCRLTASLVAEEPRFSGPGPNPPNFSGDSWSVTHSNRSLVDLQGIVDLGAGHRLLAGAAHEDRSVEHESTSPWGTAAMDVEQVSRAVFGLYSFTGGRRVEANVGARLDDFSSFGSHATWRVGGRLTPDARFVLRANAGTAFRAPSLADLFYPGYSNPDLAPEENVGWDVGAECRTPDGRLRGEVTWFGNSFKNLIAYSAAAFRPENIAKARTGGLETAVDLWAGSGWTARLSYTWLPTAEDRLTGERLLRRSRHAGSVTVAGPLTSRTTLDVRVLAVGSSNDRDFTGFPPVTVANAGRVTCDVGVVARLAGNLSTTLRAANLFDARYEEVYGFPTLGRNLQAGFTHDF